MKNLFMMIVCLLSLNNYSQQPTDSLDINITETERIIDKYSDKIADSFNKGIEKVAPVAEQGFEIAVKFQIIKGVSGLLPFIAFLVSVFVFRNEYFRISNLLRSDDVPDNMDSRKGIFSEENMSIILFSSFIITAVTLIASFFTLPSAISYILAPEWFAIKDILEMFK